MAAWMLREDTASPILRLLPFRRDGDHVQWHEDRSAAVLESRLDQGRDGSEFQRAAQLLRYLIGFGEHDHRHLNFSDAVGVEKERQKSLLQLRSMADKTSSKMDQMSS